MSCTTATTGVSTPLHYAEFPLCATNPSNTLEVVVVVVICSRVEANVQAHFGRAWSFLT